MMLIVLSLPFYSIAQDALESENKPFHSSIESPIKETEVFNDSSHFNCWDTLFTRDKQIIPCKITQVKNRSISYKLCDNPVKELKTQRRRIVEFSRNGSRVAIKGKSRVDTSTFGTRVLIGIGVALGLIGLFYLFVVIFVV